jgi:hypothetical protein
MSDNFIGFGGPYLFEFRYTIPEGNGYTAQSLIARMIPHLEQLTRQALTHTEVDIRTLLVKTTVPGTYFFNDSFLSVPRTHYGVKAVLEKRFTP